MNLAIVSESPAVSPADLSRMVEAAVVQTARDFCPIWDLEVPAMRVFATEKDAPADWALIVFLPSSDVAGALGYHSETPEGRKFARVFTNGQTLPEIQETFTHEVLEALLDPGCNLWAQDANGALWALESSDAVQGQAYPIDLGDGLPPVMVSDFVLPPYFDQSPAPGSRFNWNTNAPLPGPFTVGPMGYSVIMSGGQTRQVGGFNWAGPSKAKRHPVARTARRMGPTVSDTIPAPGQLGFL